MSCRALQIVGEGIVVFIAQGFFNHTGQCWCDSAELLMAKGIFMG